LVVVLIAILGVTFKVQKVKSGGTIYIRNDGSVAPSDAPISSVDNITYTLTNNIYDNSIIVERDNIIVDGAGYILQGMEEGTGISLWARTNVTIKNMHIKALDNGILLSGSSNNNVSGNTITSNGDGIRLHDSSNNNSICRNNLENNLAGIWLFGSYYNGLHGNNIRASEEYGIALFYSLDNIVSGNKVTANSYGIFLYASSNNSIYHNSFVSNTNQVYVYTSDSVNAWDNGYPSSGNYWSDYDGADSDYDGIGDTPYFIEANNQDNYPLMGMFSSFNTSYGYAVDFVSNSSISDISFNLSPTEVYPPEAILAFNVSNETGTEGFLRVCIPKILINGSYVIMFDDQVITNTTYPQVRELPCSNETHVYFYINYSHSEHTIIITGTTLIPEFPSFLILPLFMIATLLAVIFYRRKR
jgi:parallel beta-helix repeat protein